MDGGLKPCWWCGGIAETREHRFKSADLKRLFQRGEPGGLILFGDGTPQFVQGPKSDRVKFSKSLCSTCNNVRSQPFDRAYDTFTDYTWRNFRQLETATTIDFKEIYDTSWKTGRIDLARYIMKYFCCRLDADGRQIPAQIISFLNGARYMPNVEVGIYFDDVILNNKRRHSSDGDGELMLLWHSPVIAYTSKATGKTTCIYGESTIGYVGFIFGWNPGISRADPFYRHRRPALSKRSQLPMRELRDDSAPIFRFNT